MGDNMYNGIGLATVRGSGTNGYVQRNTAFVSKGREDIKYKTEEDIKRLDAQANREPNQGILDHERKRKLEVKCIELEELLEEQGYTEEEVLEKVNQYRKMLLSKEGDKKAFAEVDEFGRPVYKETHQIAEAQKEKNKKLKEAFGISQHFVEGSSFDPNGKAIEDAAREAERAERLAPREEQKRKEDGSSSSGSDSEDSDKERKKKKKKKRDVERKRSVSRNERKREKGKRSRSKDMKETRRDDRGRHLGSVSIL